MTLDEMQLYGIAEEIREALAQAREAAAVVERDRGLAGMVGQEALATAALLVQAVDRARKMEGGAS